MTPSLFILLNGFQYIESLHPGSELRVDTEPRWSCMFSQISYQLLFGTCTQTRLMKYI